MSVEYGAEDHIRATKVVASYAYQVAVFEEVFDDEAEVHNDWSIISGSTLS